ncbi:MAG TPA: rhomboid family intramembrane serine protease [Abditibacteriaceae bacterium]|jgi:membrane associated rhomboid family serine protease/outer membrane protein assembly factor BamD (BamD/ComL family)
MIFPYNVDRPTRRVPYWTYGLIGINTFIFLMTVFIANLNLPTDRVTGVNLIQEMTKNDKTLGMDEAGAEEDEEEKTDAAAEGTDTAAEKQQLFSAPKLSQQLSTDEMGPQQGQFRRLFRPRLYRQPASEGDKSATDNEAKKDEDSSASDEAKQDIENMMLLIQQRAAMEKAFKNANDAEGYTKFWQIEHAYSTFAGDPHYSVLNTFAYRASNPTPWGLLVAMFLHGGFMHLLGNMLFLWVFGRALEDTLGPMIYVGAYVLCGIAATLMYHVMMMMFTPASAGLPSLGASGAIAGVLGLFALRFYRTPVRLFYVLPNVLIVVLIIGALLGAIGGFVLGLPGLLIGFFGTWVAFFMYARAWAWGTFKAASAWVIGAWLLIYNIYPGVMSLTRDEKSGGTAYWAHIGGFMFGMLYALLIGSKGEGSLEYALEDAQKAYDSGQMEPAIERATNVLSREPNNAGAYEVLAKSYDGRGRESEALDNYEIAIQKYLQAGEREAAVNTYLHSLSKNPGFILDPKLQMALGSQMARMALYKESAENLAKIPFTYPEAPEGELALLRSAQVYLEHLNEPDMALHLLHTLLERYPDTQWMQQVERGMKMAQYQMNPPEEGFAEAETEQENVSTRVQAQLPQIKR